MMVSMKSTKDHVRSAAECLREAERCEALAGNATSESHREIFLTVAAQWRKLAGEPPQLLGGQLRRVADDPAPDDPGQ
jgi:hypothetical protein